MNTIIIEDEKLTARWVEDLLRQYDPAIRVLAVLPSVQDAVQWLSANPEPDLVFMDIHLEDELAFKIFEQVQLQAPVIFTTAYDEYTIQAFKVNSIDYLLKPINYEDLTQAMEKFKSLKRKFAQPDLDTLMQIFGQQKTTAYKSRFMITIGNKIRSIETREIAYFYSEEKTTVMVTGEGQHLPIDFSLDKLTTLLDPAVFFRISRQYLVAFPAIQAAHNYFKGKLKLDLLPKAKIDATVSAEKVTQFKEWLGR